MYLWWAVLLLLRFPTWAGEAQPLHNHLSGVWAHSSQLVTNIKSSIHHKLLMAWSALLVWGGELATPPFARSRRERNMKSAPYIILRIHIIANANSPAIYVTLKVRVRFAPARHAEGPCSRDNRYTNRPLCHMSWRTGRCPWAAAQVFVM